MSRWRSLGWAAAIGAAAVSCLVFSRQDVAWRTDAFWRLACALMFVYGLPGLFLLRLLVPARPLALMERIPLAFGMGHLLVTAECAASMSFGGSLQAAWVAHVAVTFLLGVACAIRLRRARPEPSPSGSPRAISVAAGVLLGATLLLQWRAGGLWKQAPIDEESFNLAFTRKYLDLDAYTLRNVYYREDMALPNLFAPYQFMTAMVAKASALDPVIVYTNFHAYWGLVAMASLYSIAKLLTQRADAAWICVIGGCMLAMSNAAGQFDEAQGSVYWGQLTPMSHATGFSADVLGPVMLVFTLHAWRDGRVRSPWVWIGAPVILACTMTHSRAGAQALFHAMLIGGAVLIWRPREWRALRPVAALVALTVLLGIGFRWAHHETVEWVVEHEAANRVQLIQSFERHYQDHPPYGLFTSWYYNGDASLFRPYFSFAMLLAPLWLLVRDRSRWTCAFWGLITLFMLIYRIPPLVLWIIRSTYSEFFWAPARFISLASYLSFGIVLFSLTPVLDGWVAGLGRRLPAAVRWIAVMDVVLLAGGGLFLATHAVGWSVDRWPRAADGLYLWLVVGTLAIAWLRRRWGIDESRLFPDRLTRPGVVAASLVLALTPQFFLERTGRDLVQRAIDMRLPQAYATEAEFYNAHYGDRLPPHAMLVYLREHVGAPRVVAFPPECEVMPLMFLNHYAFSAGVQPYMRDVAFVERYCSALGRTIPAEGDRFSVYQRKSELYIDILVNDQPFFGAHETPERLRKLVEAFGVEYAVAPDDVARRIAALHGSARVVHSTDGWTLISFTDP